jgi:hypothetical protein
MKEQPRLYRFELLDEGMLLVNWVWLCLDEVSSYLANQSKPSPVIHRRATKEEEELYDEAYEDGYGVAMVEEITATTNGLTYRVEFNKDADGEVDANGFSGHKMFECATCGKHKDLDTEVAVIDAGPWYLSTLRDDVLWFNCYDCTSLAVDISEIELEADPDEDKID